jgi:hypothetical protein
VGEVSRDAVLRRASEALELGRHAEAIELLADLVVTAPETDQGMAASRQLDTLVSGLSIEPASEWLADDATQRVGSTRSLLASGEPLPSVLVTLREGPARVAVHGLTMEFTFSSGDSSWDPVLVRTSEFGTASAPAPTGLEIATDVEVAVRPVARTTRAVLALREDPLVFTYDGPSAMFGAVAIGWVDGGQRAAPDVAEVLVSRLQPFGEVVIADLAAVGETMGLGAGGPEAVRAVAAHLDSAVLAVAHVEIQDVVQVEYGGRLYDIWKAEAVVRLTIYDPADSRAILAASSSPFSGQGGSEADAVADAMRVAAEELDSLLTQHERQLQSLPFGSLE